MKRFFLILAVIIASMPMAIKAANIHPEISDDAEFYMIACEPGQEAYQLFGHAAIRVVDKSQGMDVAFNWGVFSFDAPNFIGRFVVGKTDYELAVWSTDLFLEEYRERGSAVHQFHINLDSTEKHRLWEKLCTNYEPQNRVYRYNFIYDNCATRVVDMILESYDSIDAPQFDMPAMTYRQFVTVYAQDSRWIMLGINLVFGKEADRIITARESATFPLQAMQLLANAKVKRDSTETNILYDHTFLCNEKQANIWREKSNTGTIIMCIPPLAVLLLLIFLFVYKKRYHHNKIATEIVLWTAFAFSLLIIFLQKFTIHPFVHFNYNIMWCSPLAGILAIILLIHHHKYVKTYAALITLLLTLGFIIVLAYSTQSISAPLFCWYLMVAGCELLVLLSYLPRYVSHLRHKMKGIQDGPKKKHHHHHHRSGHHHHHHEG